MKSKLEKLVTKLDAIAKANGDKFSSNIEINTHYNVYHYRFICSGLVAHDVYSFTIVGYGFSLDEAITDVNKKIIPKCEHHNYSIPKKYLPKNFPRKS